MDDHLLRSRHGAWLVAPLVTFSAVVALLFAARFYHRLPAHPPACGFRTATGIPCLGCGGTRSARALASGDFLAAIRFNPAFVIGALLSVAWVAIGTYRFLCGTPPPPVSEQNRRIRRNLVLLSGLLLANWVYLILFLT